MVQMPQSGDKKEVENDLPDDELMLVSTCALDTGLLLIPTNMNSLCHAKENVKTHSKALPIGRGCQPIYVSRNVAEPVVDAIVEKVSKFRKKGTDSTSLAICKLCLVQGLITHSDEKISKLVAAALKKMHPDIVHFENRPLEVRNHYKEKHGILFSKTAKPSVENIGECLEKVADAQSAARVDGPLPKQTVDESIAISVALGDMSTNIFSRSPQLKEIFTSVGASVDGRTINKNINNIAKAVNEKAIAEMKGKLATLAFDEWADTHCRKFFVALLIYNKSAKDDVSDGVYIINAEEMVTLTSVKKDDALKLMTSSLKTAQDNGVNVSCIITDNGTTVRSPRTTLATEHNLALHREKPEVFTQCYIINLPCICHQFNRLISDLVERISDEGMFKRFHEFSKSLRKKHRENLRRANVNILYGNSTRWDSHYIAGITMLRLYQAYHSEDSSRFDFLDQDDKDFLENNSDLWSRYAFALQIIFLLCNTIDTLQADDADLTDAVRCLDNLKRDLSTIGSTNPFVDEVLEKLESRFAHHEFRDLLLLARFFDIRYPLTDDISYMSITDALKRVYFGKLVLLSNVGDIEDIVSAVNQTRETFETDGLYESLQKVSVLAAWGNCGSTVSRFVVQPEEHSHAASLARESQISSHATSFVTNFIKPLFTAKISTATLERVFAKCGRIITKFNYRVRMSLLISKLRIALSQTPPKFISKKRRNFDIKSFISRNHQIIAKQLASSLGDIEFADDNSDDDAPLDVPFAPYVNMEKDADENPVVPENQVAAENNERRKALLLNYISFRNGAQFNSISVASALTSGGRNSANNIVLSGQSASFINDSAVIGDHPITTPPAVNIPIAPVPVVDNQPASDISSNKNHMDVEDNIDEPNLRGKPNRKRHDTESPHKQEQKPRRRSARK